MNIPKICLACEMRPPENVELPYDLCGYDPRECALEKARMVKRAKALAVSRGCCIDEILSDPGFIEQDREEDAFTAEELFPDVGFEERR